jgi:amino acid transporter
VAILVQAGVASLFIVASHLGATVREAYLVVVDMTTVLTFLPYLYIFLSVPRLRLTGSEPGVVRIPGGRAGVWYVALAGGATTALSIATSLIPPSEVKNVALFEAKLLGGLAIFAAGGYVLYRRSAGRGTLDQRREGQGDGGALPPMR